MIFLIVQGQINHQLIYELQQVVMPLNKFNFQKITLRKDTRIYWVDKFYGQIIIILKLLFKIQMLQKVKIILLHSSEKINTIQHYNLMPPNSIFI